LLLKGETYSPIENHSTFIIHRGDGIVRMVQSLKWLDIHDVGHNGQSRKSSVGCEHSMNVGNWF